MSGFALSTPVALLVFNRPAQTARVFAAVRAARPPILLLVADGPRANRDGEAERCAEVRRIVELVDWPCQVRRDFSESNLGCRQRVASGLDWVFSEVEEAIILEDDCLPDPSFFRFCQELLKFHRYEEQVMMVCGTNLLGSWKGPRPSYHFSHYDWVWGWATWRRAWRHYDVDMERWGSDAGKIRIREVLNDERHYALRAATFEQAFLKQVDTWDYQWAFCRILQGGVAVIPSLNLVSNIGYGVEATHTKVQDVEFANLTARRLTFPLAHPDGLSADLGYDLAIADLIRRKNSWLNRVVRICSLLRLYIFKAKGVRL